MDTAFITAMAGVLGSLVGGSATVAATWVTQRTLSKRELIRTEIRRRETLYGEFISECSARIIDSFERTLEKPETLLHAYALLNRIRLCASDAVLAQGEATLRFITEQYFSPNLSVDEMRKLVRKWTTDPLEPFGEACRLELKSIRAAV
jgi:hypothetical protein